MRLLTLAALTVLSVGAIAIQSVHAGHHEAKDHEEMMHGEMESGAMMHDFDKAKFEMAMEEGKHIVVDVYKDGCPVCAKQHPILEKAMMDYPEAVFFRVNFKKDMEAVKMFDARSQSTIIVFQDGEEISRTIGETDSAKLLMQIGGDV